ncbi:MAG: hypothetical protein IKS19_02430 [Clostridia bacterium]|nr:hypothetical protein [Clostridia bacterium]
MKKNDPKSSKKNDYITPFDKYFDFNRDGKMSCFEKAMRDTFFINYLENRGKDKNK